MAEHDKHGESKRIDPNGERQCERRGRAKPDLAAGAYKGLYAESGTSVDNPGGPGEEQVTIVDGLDERDLQCNEPSHPL